MNKALIFFGLMLLLSCATRYRAIKPEELSYSAKNENNCIRYSYKYDVLAIRGNKKHTRKESKYHIKVVAVEFTNISDSAINLKDDLIIRVGNNQVIPMEPKVVKARIHQNVPIYLLYSFIFVYKTECNYGGCETQRYPIGIPIAIGNMLLAGTSNQKFLKELEKYNLDNISIKPGETKHGIVCFNAINNEPISFKLNNKDCGEDINPYINIEGTVMDLSSNLYYNSSDSTYQNYTNRMEKMLKQDKVIISYKFIEKKSQNGSFKYRGFKAKHKYGSNDDYYKIGTWEFYKSNGELEKTINYNFKEKVEKEINY